MSSELNETLLEILNSMGIIPLIFLVLNFQKLKKHAAAWYLVFSLVIFIIQYITGSIYGMRNWWATVLWTIISLNFLSIINWQMAYGKKKKLIMTILGFTAAIVSTTFYIFVYDWQYEMRFATLIENSFIIVLSIWSFFDLALNSKKNSLLEEPSFWYFSGLILFGSVLLFRNFNEVVVSAPYYLIQGTAYLILCITFTIGLYVWKKQLQ